MKLARKGPDLQGQPAISRLFNLKPLSIGTPYTESITSYISRLAAQHVVSVQKMFSQQILPEMREAFDPEEPANRTVTDGYFRNSASFNGAGRMALDVLRSLEGLTGRRDLIFCTMYPWALALGHRRLLKDRFAWCPLCFTEWRDNGDTIYEPLIWSLRVVEICPRHEIRLTESCPHNHKSSTMRHLAHNSRVGYCSRCHGWLGGSSSSIASAPTGIELEWQRWVVAQVGSLIEQAPRIKTGNIPGKSQVDQFLASCIKLAGGRSGRFAESFGFSAGIASSWARNCSPDLAQLLQISWVSDTPILHALKGTIPTVIRAERAEYFSYLRTFTHRPKTAFSSEDVEAIRITLEEALSGFDRQPKSVTDVANFFKINVATLNKRYPELCSQLAQRYRKHRTTQSLISATQTISAIQNAIRNLYERDIYPSAVAVEKALGKPGLLRNKVLKNSWRAFKDLLLQKRIK